MSLSQAEVLARIFGLLDWQQLSQVEAVSRRCRSIGEQAHSAELCPALCQSQALAGVISCVC